MADEKKPAPASPGAPMMGQPDHSKPGWPIAMRGIGQAPAEHYEQFPERFRPVWTESTYPFDAKSKEQVEGIKYVTEERASDLLTLVHMRVGVNALVSVPGRSQVAVAKVGPFCVIAVPREDAVPMLKELQYASRYPVWALVAPRGECGGKQSFSPVLIDQLGNQVNKQGQPLQRGEEPVKGNPIETCPFLGCSHFGHSLPDAPPLSARQAFAVLDRIRENPETTQDLRDVSELIDAIGAMAEIDKRSIVNSYGMVVSRYVTQRAAHVKGIDKVMRFRDRLAAEVQ